MGLCLGKLAKANKSSEYEKKQQEIQKQLQLSKDFSLVIGKGSQFSDQDYFYNYDNWYEKDHYKGELLFSKNLFIKLYQNYAQLQQTYSKNFIDIILESNPQAISSSNERGFSNNIMFKLRYLVRRGSNVGLIRRLIKNKFRLEWNSFEQKYEIMKTVVFEHSSSSDVRLVPTFSQHSVQQLLQVHCLNKAGESSLKRILWVIRENYPKLDYNPMIIQVCAICLIFFNEYETYLLLKTMIDDSFQKLDEKKQINQEVMKDLRWYFTTSYGDYKKNAKLFFDVACQRSSGFKEIIEFLDSKNFDYIQQFIDWTTHFFLNILRFSTVLRIWTIYLNEGIRTLYKITFGIWMTVKDQVKQMQTSDEIKEFLKTCKIDKTIEETDQLFVTAYYLKIKKINKFFREILSSQNSPQMKIIYRPRTKEKSQIITYQHFEAIWDWIPSQFKISNPTLIYSTFKDGYSFNTLYLKGAQHINSPMLLLLKTPDQQKFGVFSETMIRIGHGDNFYGTEDIFLFCLEPKEVVFMPTGTNQHYIQSTRQKITFGSGSDGPGLTINENLNGQSSVSDTFDNLPLHGNFKDKNFKIMSIELYYLSS
ncbi:TLD domain protein (macronuclear) [Tetrahymena thermophila SB210]|uniref:TLD domain protein n=1 Tax=Tetrahymena thermophila (strain SB210) TaxID=312017 RepID=I7LWE2_TETTS|nr:TLD domain protein [Tetrahymena thermophila SB210]EAS01464.2 TLD domain protein [Tetrahymena thermophila SB210]|eukprot:XP_001021710.2 TLD domain protein [Tetrahymena thermophila SB210]